MSMEDQRTDLLPLTADLVAAYVSNNPVPAGQLATLITSIHDSLSGLMPSAPIAPQVEPRKPAVSIKKSVTPDFLISLEDGKKYKSLKRHLGVKYGMTPDEYRAKWGLPSDYPMVAPNYTASRSELAKRMGLGRKAKPVELAAPKTRKRNAKA